MKQLYTTNISFMDYFSFRKLLRNYFLKNIFSFSICCIALLFFNEKSFATIYTYNGNPASALPVYWSNATLWQGGNYPGVNINSGDTVIIAGGNLFGGVVIDVQLANNVCGTIMCVGTKTLVVGNPSNPNKMLDNDGTLIGLNITVGQPTSTFNNFSTTCTIGSLYIANGTVNNYSGATMNVGAANILTNSSFNNYGYIIFNGFVNFVGGYIDNTFAMNFASGAQLYQSGTTLSNSGSTVFQNGSRWTLESASPYVNSGQIKLLSGSVLRYNQGVDLDDLMIFNGANIYSGNNATINDTVTVQSNSTFWLGEGSTTDDTQVNIAGDFTTTGNLKLDWRGISYAPVYEVSRMNITGDAHLGGTLTINALNGYMPNSNYGFLIMIADTVHGSFSNIVWPTGWTGQVYYNFPLDGWVTAFIQAISTTPPQNDNPCQSISVSSTSGSIAGHPTLLVAFDNGSSCYSGVANLPTAEPPSGPNLVYYTGITNTATGLGAYEPTPPCGVIGASPKSVWYKFKSPTLGGVDIKIRTAFTATDFPTIISAYVISSGSVCVPSGTGYANIGCSTNGTLTLSASSLVSYAGQYIYVQLTGANSTAGNFMMSVQGLAPGISLSNPTASSLTVNVPSVAGATSVILRWQPMGGTGYSQAYLSPSTSSYVINGLSSGINYNVWVGYVNTSQQFYSLITTLSTTAGCSLSPSSPSATAVVGHCSRATITWAAHPLASTAYPYRLYYRVIGSAGFNSVAVTTNSYTVGGLVLNTTYEFFYRVICTGGGQINSTIGTYATCTGPAKESNPNTGSNSTLELNGRYFTDADFTEIVAYADNTVADGTVHEIILNEVKNMDENNSSPIQTEGLENGNCSLLPNPAANNVAVNYELKNELPLTIRLTDIQGKIMEEKRIEAPGKSGVSDFNLSTLAAGIYLVTIQTDDYRATRKLVIAK